MTQKEEIEAAKTAGFAYWIENGVVCTAPPVDSRKFGEHRYGNGPYKLGACLNGCGCFMGQSNSHGPVDPFGPCPRNPKASAI